MKFPMWFRWLAAATFIFFIVNLYVFLRVSPHLVDRLFGLVSVDKLMAGLD
jgi:hypothetical protein